VFILLVLDHISAIAKSERFSFMWCVRADKKRGTRPAIFDGCYVEIGHYTQGTEKIFYKQNESNPLVLEFRSYLLPLALILSAELELRCVHVYASLHLLYK
jgi:hypothetical protein